MKATIEERMEKKRNKLYDKLIKLKKQEEQDKEKRLAKLKAPPPPPPPIRDNSIDEVQIVPPPKETKQPGIVGRIEELTERIDSIIPNTSKERKEAEKRFGLPSKIKRQLKNLALKNKVLVILLTRNRKAEPIITEIKDGFIVINNIPHNVSPDFIFLWQGKYPTIVLPEWDLNPIGTKDYYTAIDENRISEPISIAIRMLEQGQALLKGGKLSSKAWIFIGLAVIAGLYILFGGG